jgi:hypothetical protein
MTEQGEDSKIISSLFLLTEEKIFDAALRIAPRTRTHQGVKENPAHRVGVRSPAESEGWCPGKDSNLGPID